METGQTAAMILQTFGMVAGFFIWIRKVEREISSRTEELVSKAVKDQEKIYGKIDVLTEKIGDMKIDSMREFHSISQSLLRLTDEMKFALRKDKE